MFDRPRIIPCLLINNKDLVKTKNFKNPKYLGDPINAVKIYNEKMISLLNAETNTDIEKAIKVLKGTTRQKK